MSCGCGCGGEVVAYEEWGEEDVTAAEYQGRSVTLNKPFRTSGGPKKFGVYTKNEKGNVVLVRFGDPNMEIKRDDPARRKAFRSRHNCDNPGPKHKARYWSCRQWRGGKKVEAEEGCGCGNVEADERSTPAPKKDRIKGSPKNKPDSAKSPSGKITFSESVTNSLKNKVKEHNEKSDRKVSLGMLKSVYRRGAGAYSTSHRPGVSRAAWSMARVNAFLKLVRSGSPSNSKYVQDNDLLPKGHPRKSKKASMDYCEDCPQKAACAEHGGCMKEASVDDEERLMDEMRRKFSVEAEVMSELVEAALPKPTSEESHDQFMSRCMGDSKMNDEFSNEKQRYAVCMRQHEGHEFKTEAYHKKKDKEAAYDNSCGVGEKMVDGKCQKVAVTLDLEIDNMTMILEASKEGGTKIRIEGIAFHEGRNKNNWSLTKEGAIATIEQMVGSDVTLLHPKSNEMGAGFTRNMDGGVEEATVGYIESAELVDLEDGKWNVKYVAYVVREELFPSLEAGLWSREGYGVSIGGSGVPISAEEDNIVFGEDFKFDHLAIVHKPAYQRANIEKVERIEKEEVKATLISHSESASVNKGMVMSMSEEKENTINEEMEALQAELVLANARVAEFEAEKIARAEEERSGFVAKASELGMTGHEDLSKDTLVSLIASWEAAHPEPTPVEMTPVESVEKVEASVETPTAASPVVANYLNGKMVSTDEQIYARAWNAWASAWNSTLGVEEKKSMAAPSYSQKKEMN